MTSNHQSPITALTACLKILNALERNWRILRD